MGETAVQVEGAVLDEVDGQPGAEGLRGLVEPSDRAAQQVASRPGPRRPRAGTARDDAVVVQDSTTSASAPTGEVQPASSAASSARSAVTAARVSASLRAATDPHQVGVVGAALDRQRALAGRRQHLQRVEDLGRLVGAAEPEQAGAGQHDGVQRPSPTDRSRVSTLPRIGCDLQAEAEREHLRGAARRTGAEPRAGGQLAEGQAVAGDQHVARVRADAGRRRWSGRARRSVGRSLSEWTARSTSPASSARRSAVAKTPVPPILERSCSRGSRRRTS